MDTLVVSASSEICVTSFSEAETEELGRRIGEALKGGELVALTGPLGAGKTALVRGIAAGAGSQDVVSSPTFVLERPYVGRIAILHVDLYRLDGGRQDGVAAVCDLSIDDVLDAGGVALVEWGEKLPACYLERSISVIIDVAPDDSDTRVIRMNGMPGLVLN